MDILVIGVGYVGLVTGTCFAEMGYLVTCLDINATKIAALQQGIVPFYEPGLEEMVQRNARAGRLHFTTDYSYATARAHVCFIAVDTPSSPSGEANLSAVEDVAEALGDTLQHDCIVVTKSTVPVGTTERVATLLHRRIAQRNLSVQIDVVSNPEFLKEGSAIQDFMKPDRVIVGVCHERAATVMRRLYAPFMLNHDRLLVMDIRSAELAKYAANAMLATRISFMNDMAHLCEQIGADVNAVRKAIGSDGRIGMHFLYPGPGFGGSCLPKDVRALLAQASQYGVSLQVIKAAHEVNQRQKQRIGEKISTYFSDKGGLQNKTIGILGLSFKPDTDDMREAPSLVLIDELLLTSSHLRLYDPIAMERARALIGHIPTITWCRTEDEVARGADALVLMTEWKQFRLLNFQELLASMTGRAFFDARNQYQPEEMAHLGFDYFSMGRQPCYAEESAAIPS